MHNIHIVTSIADEASGPTYSVTRLAEALAARGNQSEIYSLAERSSTSTRHLVTLRTFDQSWASFPWLSQLSYSAGLRNALASQANHALILHNHGLWRMPNVYAGLIAARSGAKLVVSPRGMLGDAALKFSSAKKHLFWTLAQQRALRTVDCYHATSLSELDEIRAFGETAPVALVPNGIDVPDTPLPVPKRSPDRIKTILHLGRLHPKKGVERLLKAWLLVAQNRPDWRLRIVGPSEGGHGEQLRKLSVELGLERVYIEGPIYGNEKCEAYREADLFVLPTLNENFGMVIAEALAEGTPAISTKGAPWKGLQDNGCGWWVDHGAEAMAEALNTAISQSEVELHDMGARGQAWMRRDFSWNTIADQMETVYRWCQGSVEQPEFINLIGM